ncbi:hypothetical protein NEIG_02546, partial [Nematocida sp. ERTm5]
LFQKVKLYTEKLILSLSKTYNEEENSELARRIIFVCCLNMIKPLNINGQMDIFGEILISYNCSNLKGELELNHTIKHVQTTSIFKDNNILADRKKTKIINKKKRVESVSEKTLTDFLLMHYIEKVLGEEKDTSDYSKENINLSGENNYSYPIEKLFLYNTFKRAEDRIEMINYVRRCLLGYPLKETDPWARFLSNMIGSLPLNNYNTLQNVFFNPMYREGVYNSFCTKVNIPPMAVDKHIDLYKEYKWYENYIIDSNLLSGHLEILKAYLIIEGHTSCFFRAIIPLLGSPNSIKLFSILTHGGKSINRLLELEEFLNGIDRKLPEYEKVMPTNDMWLLWLKLSLVSDEFNNITSMLFDKIVVSEGFITRKGIKYECTDENIDKAIIEFNNEFLSNEVKENVFSLIKKNPEYARTLSYFLEKYASMNR